MHISLYENLPAYIHVLVMDDPVGLFGVVTLDCSRHVASSHFCVLYIHWIEKPLGRYLRGRLVVILFCTHAPFMLLWTLHYWLTGLVTGREQPKFISSSGKEKHNIIKAKCFFFFTLFFFINIL